MSISRVQEDLKASRTPVSRVDRMAALTHVEFRTSKRRRPSPGVTFKASGTEYAGHRLHVSGGRPSLFAERSSAQVVPLSKELGT